MPQVKIFNCITNDMDAKEFNELLKLQKDDKTARCNFYEYCLLVIKRRLLYRGEFDNVESLSHSILQKFVNNLPSHVNSPCSYLCKCTDNFLYDRKKKRPKIVPLVDNLSYEQYFEFLELQSPYSDLRKYLDEVNAKIIYMYAVEGAKEYEIAERLGLDLSYGAIRQRISRSKKLLRDKLKNKVTKDGHLLS